MSPPDWPTCLVRLQFVAEHDLGSWAIRWFGAGDVSHVDAVLPGGNLLGARSDHVGGRPPGVQIRPPGYATFSRRVVVDIRTTPHRAASCYRFLHGELGKPYDTTAIFAFAANRNWREPDSWICSELIGRALEVSRIFPHDLYLATNKVAPVPLALAISALPEATFYSG